MVWKTFEGSANGIDVSAYVHHPTRQLFRGSKGDSTTYGIRKGIGIATAKVDEFDVRANTGKQDVVGL